MRNLLLLLSCLLCIQQATAQLNSGRNIDLIILSADKTALSSATVSLWSSDSARLRTEVSNAAGKVQFTQLPSGTYFAKITRIGHENLSIEINLTQTEHFSDTIQLKPLAATLGEVTVSARKPFIQHLPDKTVVNVEAGISNAGTSVLEVLEKSPGVTVDRDGGISLKGRSGVQIMIDGKLTQLAGADLQNFLSGMSSTQVETIELIDNPSAKYDAAGNSGIINIKTKKNKQKGFNGSLTVAYGQGRYPKNNNNLLLNFRNGKFNFFANYSLNASVFIMDMYALRTYFNEDGTIASKLEQPFFTKTNAQTHNLKAGMDYYLDKKTTLGITLTGMNLERESKGRSTARWTNASGIPDSSINTISDNSSLMKLGGLNLNGRHSFDANRELTADFDFIDYDIQSDQFFENRINMAGSIPEATKGIIPSSLRILSGKADYAVRKRNTLLETGWKSSRVTTDNLAQYYYRQVGDWTEDLGKSNHFLYTENIHALYANAETKAGKWSIQGGLRYEFTSYRATQLGNAITKDSSFNRKYHNLFPSLFVTYQADSLNSFTVRAGQRIDRPAFQKLNPFVFILNKYTYQQGNPYFKPQFTWNFELSHNYKEVLTTSVSYNLTKDYISQIFLSDTSTGLIIYTEGNIGRLQNLGFTVSTQLSPAKWWSLSAQGTVNHKRIQGVLWRVYQANITQGNFSINNQFRFAKGWGAELSGFYISKNQNDIQEVLDPSGQVAVGVSKQLFKGKGNVRLTVRDIFYTQIMAGNTDFESVQEYFKLFRDTRVATISFTYRFGKTLKSPSRRSTGGAGDVMERVGTVN